MKVWSGAVALAFAAAMAATANGQIVNAKCPVKTGSAAKASIATQYEGKTIGFC